MVDALRNFFTMVMDPNPFKEKRVEITLEQFEELQKIVENAYEYKHARVKSS